MDDAGPLFAADAAQIADVMEERVDERAARVTGRRMDDHAGRLVDDDEIAILIDDRQRKRFWSRRRVDRLGDVDRDFLSRPDRLVRFGGAPAHANVALFDEPLNLRAGMVSKDGHEE